MYIWSLGEKQPEFCKKFVNFPFFRMACRVLLATLSIPLPSAHPEFDRFIETDKSPLEKAQRLATLLGLPQPPTRASLLKDIVSFYNTYYFILKNSLTLIILFLTGSNECCSSGV